MTANAGAWRFPPAVWRIPAPELLCLLPILWARLAFLTTLPIYYDEAIHISLARIPLFIPKYFDAFVHARWLNVMLLTLFQPLGLESLWLSRAVTVLLSLVTAAATYYVGRWAGGRTIARLALLIYAVMPFAYFYDRQAMSDPIMAAFGALGLVFAIRAQTQLRLRDAAIAGLVFGLSILTKFSGGLYLLLPLVLAALLPSPNRRRAWMLAVVQVVIAAVLFGSIFYLAWRENGGTSESVGAANWCHSPQCVGQFNIGQALSLTQLNLGYYLSSILPFYTPVIWLLALVAIVLGLRQRNRKWLFLAIPAFLFVLPYIPVADLFPPRYYIHTLVPISVLAAAGTHWLWQRLSSWTPSLQRILRGALALTLFVPALWLESWQATGPVTAPLAAWEATQYEAGWPAGQTVARVANSLTRIDFIAGRRVNVIVDHTVNTMNLEFYAYWGERLGRVQSLRDATEAQIIPWLMSGDPLCLLLLEPRDPTEPSPFGLVIQPIASFPITGAEQHPDQYGNKNRAALYCAFGANEDLSNQIATYAFGDPASAADSYKAVADYLRDKTGPILLYPSNQLKTLRAQPGMAAADLHPLLWPVEFTALTNQVEQATQTADDVWAVFAFDDRNATSPQLQAWFYSTLYRVDTQYFGPVKVTHFKTGAMDAQPINQSFGGLVELSDASVVYQNDDALRVSLTWQSLAATPTSYKVFTHVSDSSGQLVAQRDDYPQADLTPTNIWQSGQEVVDRFAVTLPPELASGAYTIRVGLYDPASGERLTTPDGLDSVEIGQWTVP